MISIRQIKDLDENTNEVIQITDGAKHDQTGIMKFVRWIKD